MGLLHHHASRCFLFHSMCQREMFRGRYGDCVMMFCSSSRPNNLKAFEEFAHLLLVYVVDELNLLGSVKVLRNHHQLSSSRHFKRADPQVLPAKFSTFLIVVGTCEPSPHHCEKRINGNLFGLKKFNVIEQRAEGKTVFLDEMKTFSFRRNVSHCSAPLHSFLLMLFVLLPKDVHN